MAGAPQWCANLATYQLAKVTVALITHHSISLTTMMHNAPSPRCPNHAYLSPSYSHLSFSAQLIPRQCRISDPAGPANQSQSQSQSQYE